MGLAGSITCSVCMSRVSKGISYLLRQSGYEEGEQQRNSNSVRSSNGFYVSAKSTT